MDLEHAYVLCIDLNAQIKKNSLWQEVIYTHIIVNHSKTFYSKVLLEVFFMIYYVKLKPKKQRKGKTWHLYDNGIH